jgi:PIN domain nuclease of toxin-antitoxin system
LPVSFRDAIRNPANQVYLSAVSVWESVIKHALGRLPLPAPPAEYLPRQREAHGIATLPIEESAFQYLAQLPPLHRDPFDRLLIAQALQHEMALVTTDDSIRGYVVPLLPTN